MFLSLDSEEGLGAGTQTFEEGALPGCAGISGRGNEAGMRALGKVQARVRFSFRNKLLLRSIATVTFKNTKQNRMEQIPFDSFKLAVTLLWRSLTGSSWLRGRRVVYRIPASLSGAQNNVYGVERQFLNSRHTLPQGVGVGNEIGTFLLLWL